MDGACGPEGCGRLTAAGCVERGGKKVQKVQKVQRVQRVVDCPTGNAYKVSVTGLAFPPSLARILHRMRESAKVGPWPAH